VDLQPLTADQIREQMRQIRRDLRANVEEIVVGASQMFDWKSYVRSFPWTTVATAAILGYLLVPRRREAVATPRETKESLDKLTQEVKAAVTPPPPPPSPGLIGAVLPVLGGIALRVGTSYLTKLGTQLIDQFARDGQFPSAPKSLPAKSSPSAPSSAHRAFKERS